MAKVPWSTASDACCCEACDFIFQSLTASLPHHGFGVFPTKTLCGQQFPIDEGVRYLRQEHRGLGSSGVYCGGFPRHADHTKTYVVDPFTGYVCNTSEPGIEFWCTTAFGGAKNTQCSPTSLKWDCGTVKASSVCKEGADLPLTLTETLSDSYTLEQVASNVDQLLGANPITETNIPPGAAGHVRVGSNHSVINWGGAAATCSYFYKEFGLVMKTRLRVKFPTADKKYKLVTRNKNYGFVSETEERTTTKGQVIFVEPPSSPGYVCVEPACSFGFSAGINCTVSGSHTTKRRVCRDNNGKEVACPPCELHIGPDCNQYNTLTIKGSYTFSASATSKYTGCILESGKQISCGYSSSRTQSENDSYNSTDIRCPNKFEDTASGSYSSSNQYSESGTTAGGIGCKTSYGGGYSESWNESGNCWSNSDGDCIPGGRPSYRTHSCDVDRPLKRSEVTDGYMYNGAWCDCQNETDCSIGSLKESSERQNNSILFTQQFQFSKSSTCNGCNDKPASFDTVEGKGGYTTTMTWSNGEGADSGAGTWETTTLPWCSQTQTTNCMTFNGCVERYKLPSYSTQSNANYSCKITFTARQVAKNEPAAMYSVWYNYYDSEETLGNTGFGAASCPVRTVTAYNTQLGTTSRGGEVSISVSVPGLSTTDGKTKCRLGMSAWVYEIVPEEP